MAEELEGQEQAQEQNNPFNIDISELQEVGSFFSSNEEKEEIKTDIKSAEESVEEQTEESKQKETEDPSSHDTKDSSPFTSYAKLVMEEGLLPNFDIDKWDGKAEGLIQGMQEEIDYGVNSYKETLDPRVKWLADNIDQGIPMEDLLAVDRQRLTLANITEENLAEDTVQKDIVKQYYLETTQFPEATIDKAIERLEATGDLEEESKGFFEQLKQINVQKEQKLAQDAAVQQQARAEQETKALADFKQTLTAMDEIVPGVKVNTVMKDKIFKGLTTVVATDPVTGTPLNEIAKARLENPIDFETKFGYVWYATKGLTDFSVFGSAGKKSAIKDFEESVKNLDTNKSSNQKIRKPDVDSSLVDDMAFFSKGGGWHQ